VPVVAVMWYGTESGSPHGAVETPYGKQPLGGFTGSSGRGSANSSTVQPNSNVHSRS